MQISQPQKIITPEVGLGNLGLGVFYVGILNQRQLTTSNNNN
jgi:hypothetical protein